MNTATATFSEYRNLPLSLIDESTTNPRRTFEPSKLVELANSISISGLIQSITVRPKADRFEIIAGARRYRAAQIAELAEVPTRVLELSDEQTLEVQIIENSQREDVHPYEEASGYQRLLDLPGYDVAALASKCSKSQSHVYARLTLLALIPEVAEAFQQNEITASHANLLARLTAEQQAQAFPNAFRTGWDTGKERQLLPAKQLAAWIQSNLYLALVEAPFDKDSPTLYPPAGACVTCPKRTGYNTALFADVADDNCLDGDCYRTKIGAHIESAKSGVANLIQISTTWRPAKDQLEAELSPSEYRVIGPDGQGGKEVVHCEKAAPAIITYGFGLGKLKVVCADHDCAVHFPHRANQGCTDKEWEAQVKRNEEEREERKRQAAKREERLRALVLRVPSSGSEAQSRFLLTALVQGDLDDAMERIALRLETDAVDNNRSSNEVCAEAIGSCMPSSLFGYLAELALGSHVGFPSEGERDYLTEAEALFPKTPKQTAPVKRGGPAKKAAPANTKTQASKTAGKAKRR